MGPSLFTCNENSAYIMPRVTARAVTSCAHCTECAHRQATLCIHGTPEMNYGHAVHAS